MFEVKSLNNQQDPCNVIYKINEKFIYNEGDKIFVKTDFLIQFLNESLEKPFILYTGDSDFSPSIFLSDDNLLHLLNNPLIIEWHAQNMIILHPKVKHMPIWLVPYEDKLEFYRKNKESLRATVKKDEIFLAANSEVTNIPERSSFITIQPMPFEEYIKTMATYKYVLCPMGNGIDTHRFWEAQLCGCIPIIRCPKEFLPTYDGYNYISLPGWCYARLGSENVIIKKESIFKINTV